MAKWGILHLSWPLRRAKRNAFRLPWRLRLLRVLLSALALLLGISFLPRLWCGREAGGWYAGDAQTQGRLTNGVARWLTSDLPREHIATGSNQFDGEWRFATYMMAGMGFGQTALEHPEWRAGHLELMSQCIRRILSPGARAFDRDRWSNDAIESLDTDSDHAAFLGYFNLLLSLHRLIDAKSHYADLNDRITAALVRRIRRSKLMLLQSYPGEVYPIDNAAVIGSIGLYDRATGANHRELIRDWFDRCRRDYLDPKTGLLYQAVDAASGKPMDEARGSGTCVSVYFLSFADLAFSLELFQSAKEHLASSYFGFGLVREYSASSKGGRGDIDSGPVLLGYSVSATGFCIAGCRIHGDAEYYGRLYRTAYLFGAPVDRDDYRQFVTGGPIGDAIMFAMLTAQPKLPVPKRAIP
jgi:hypothetical protein